MTRKGPSWILATAVSVLALVGIGLMVGATALFMGLVIPFFGWGERVTSATSGPCFSWPLPRASSTSAPVVWHCTANG
jgi:hypothetical protein